MIRDPIPPALRWPFAVIALASRLVPVAERTDWRREWEAETWHVARVLRARSVPGGSSFIRYLAAVLYFSVGSLADAAWYGIQGWSAGASGPMKANRWPPVTQTAWFCLLGLVGINLAVVLASGLASNTRTVIGPLPYREPERIATVAQSAAKVASRSPVPSAWAAIWREDIPFIEDASPYRWQTAAWGSGASSMPVATAVIGEGFFPLLGARTMDGDPVSHFQTRDCRSCVYLSYGFWSRHPELQDGGRSPIVLDGEAYRVAGVLEPGFWFVSRQIAVWRLEAAPAWEEGRSGVVVRLASGVSEAAAEQELQSVLEAAGIPAWSGLVDLVPLQHRVRAVLESFGWAVILAAVMLLVGMRTRFPGWRPGRLESFRDGPGVLFFLLKTLLLLSAVLVAGLEFTPSARITMIGGTGALTEPLSSWMFLAATAGILTWSIEDQRRRCRVCLRRLGLAANVGCPGCLLLDWAGTELVCVDGHGMLHVPEMASSWRDREQWTALDDSWVGLFAKR